MTKVVVSNGAANTWVGEKFSPLLVEQIAVMLEKEETNYACLDYISVPSSSTDLIDEKWRQKAAEWMFKVVDFYDLERDIVSIGMMYLDRLFTETDLSQRWTRLQCRLVAMASLKLAIKLNETRTMNMEDMIKLGMSGDDSFTASALVEMENELLWKLSWKIFPPTTLSFAHLMICMFPTGVTQRTRYTLQELTKYMTELQICVYSFVRHPSSSKALACLMVAIGCLDVDCELNAESKVVFFERVRAVFGSTKNDKVIKALAKELRELLHHNTDLKEFIALIRASNVCDHDTESPKSSAVKTLCH
mmetsp:Transcript_18328/g.39584  ORF Transcript_18328/g.39584 Transcript_18328/m.39584 type:complete len:305 (-) Transcript_18328:125-1039(-)